MGFIEQKFNGYRNNLIKTDNSPNIKSATILINSLKNWAAKIYLNG